MEITKHLCLIGDFRQRSILIFEPKEFQPWRECLPHAWRYAYLSEGLPEISSYVVNEAMH